MDGEDLRLRLSELRSGLFIERAEIPDRLLLRALETRQLLLRRPGLRLRRGGGRQHDDLANGKTLRDGYALQLLHGPTSSVRAELCLQVFQRPVLIRSVDGDGDGLPLLDAEGQHGPQPRHGDSILPQSAPGEKTRGKDY